eukprot:scaffold96989_cov61-Phaeocystis_antarctica.AAC.3
MVSLEGRRMNNNCRIPLARLESCSRCDRPAFARVNFDVGSRQVCGVGDAEPLGARCGCDSGV